MTYYVDINAATCGSGTKENPFKQINEAARIAKPGDEIIVAPGVYREYVNPVNGGTEDKRITYRSAEYRKAVITGAEEIKNWKKVKGNVWVARIPNGIFGSYNPYKVQVAGDWFNVNFVAHTGEVFLNNKSLYEVTKMELVEKPVEDNIKSWDKEFTKHVWYTEQDEKTDETVIYANFQGKDPNKENVEITVRENCFYPSEEGRGYITLSGFTVCKAATQWAPPTAYQEGMIGPHWSKGWIIEDCEVSHSKCSGISLGKYKQPNNDNKWSKLKFKDGTQTERDNICQAQIEGWTKERIGSHIVRRCDIHDCGQTGIVGHLGGVFSIIEDNHIHHINNKQNLAGAEIGGIKMHAAIDVIIRRNHFHHCTRGLWLDWQAQGTRVSQNLFHDNTLARDYLLRPENLDLSCGEDIFIEVSHGPTLLDNNIFLSDTNLKLPTQGLAMVHNFFAGSWTAVGHGVLNGALTEKRQNQAVRYTPYHVPHRTEIMGFMSILHGDCRIYNNIFMQQPMRPGLKKLSEMMSDNEWTDGNFIAGTHTYDMCPTYEEWVKQFDGYCGLGSAPSDRYYNPLPVWAKGNWYFNGAKPTKNEKNPVVDKENTVTYSLEEKNGKWIFKTNAYDFIKESNCGMISTEVLGEAFESEQKFENPDGSEIVFNADIFGNKRDVVPLPGPFASAKKNFKAEFEF